jgi:hypothetical protein
MRKFALLIAVVALPLLTATPSHATMKFDLGTGFNFFGDSRVEGQNRHIGVAFDVNDSIDVGFFVDRADLQLTGDVGATPPNTTKINYDAMGISLNKSFSSWLSAGIDMGSAKIQQGATTGFAATAALNQTKPFVGLNVKAKQEMVVKDKFTTSVNLGLGYRILDLNDVAITGAPAGESTLDDLNAFIVSLGFGIGF